MADFPFFKCLPKEIEDPNKTNKTNKTKKTKKAKKPKVSRELGYDELEERLLEVSLQFSLPTDKSDKPNKPSRHNKPNKPLLLQPENNSEDTNYFRGSLTGSD
jgi:hypothetical protein